MRPFFLASLALVLCAATLTGETLYTKRKNNAVREGAGSYYSLAGSVPENTALVVLARSGSWVKVQLPNKTVGWISASCLTEEKSVQMAAKPAEAMWSSPRALSAAIKGFSKKYVKGEPGVVDSVLQYSEKDFTSEDLAAFTKEIREYPSGNRGRVKVEDLDLPTPEYDADLPEQQIGVSVTARIAGKGIVNNKKLRRYVNMVCATVAGTSSLYDADFTVLVLNDRMSNAFALPGGYIVVTLGLLRQCGDESELAGVIAHEMAHVYRRHGLQELSERIPQIHAEAAFNELEEELGEPTEEEKEMEALVDQTYEEIVQPRLLSYEIEADRIGAVLAANAGYDPYGLVRISERVARAPSKTAEDSRTGAMQPAEEAVERSRQIRAFAEKNFTTDMPGELMRGRFTTVTSPLR